MRSKTICVLLILLFSALYPMSKDEPDQVWAYVERLVRATLEPSVRAYMLIRPEDADVALLQRYITIVTDNYMRSRTKQLPLSLAKLPQLDINYYMCKENLQAIFEIEKIEDLKFTLGAMGILYDAYRPCNTWNNCLVVIQERIKKKRSYSINSFNWTLFSLEPKH
ncbi:hypothetical protein BH09DEP1_BH09DEP1_8260 [soil metagenome]